MYEIVEKTALEQQACALFKTFGDEYPEAIHEGYTADLVLACDIFGSVTILDVDCSIPPSPWMYHAVADFAECQTKSMEMGEVAKFKTRIHVVRHMFESTWVRIDQNEHESEAAKTARFNEETYLRLVITKESRSSHHHSTEN